MEILRSRIRDIFGYSSWPYKLASSLTNSSFAFIKGGLNGLKIIRMNKGSGPGEWLKFPQLRFPFFVRPGTEDVRSIINNVFREEYGKLPRSFEPVSILDAGAYVGDTSAYFLSRFHNAKVISLEPNEESFNLAEKNLSHYGNQVTLIKKALWHQVGTVHFGGKETGASIKDEGLEVPTTTVGTILTEHNLSHIDILKMDIEGAEVSVLQSGKGNWLKRTKILLLETHGLKIEEQVLPLLAEQGFAVHRYRNVWYCLNGAYL